MDKEPKSGRVKYVKFCESNLKKKKLFVTQMCKLESKRKIVTTFALIHIKQRNRLTYFKLEQLVYCYYNMNLKLRDMTVEKDKVNETDFMDLLQVVAEVRDDNKNHIFNWVRPTSLVDDERNLDSHIASHA